MGNNLRKQASTTTKNRKHWPTSNTLKQATKTNIQNQTTLLKRSLTTKNTFSTIFQTTLRQLKSTWDRHIETTFSWENTTWNTFNATQNNLKQGKPTKTCQLESNEHNLNKPNTMTQQREHKLKKLLHMKKYNEQKQRKRT